MRIEIDTYPKVLTDAERLRVARKVSARFSPQTADRPLLSVVRPLEDICRHCAQREPLGKSKYCRPCIEIMARIDDRHKRNIPSVGYFILFCFFALLIYWSLSGWMDLEKKSLYQRTNSQVSREAK